MTEVPASSYQDKDTPRISAYIARDAATAVVLRRGPGVKTLMSKWDLETDTFQHGQWLHSRVYAARCDISPCGEYFLYFTGRFKGHFYAFTALCPPPFFSAHILWPQDHTWGGGGLFDAAQKTVLLNYNFEPDEKTKAKKHKSLGPADFGALPPPYTRVLPMGEYSGSGEDAPIEHRRLTRDGWALTDTITKAQYTFNPVTAPDDPSVKFQWKTEGAEIWTKPLKDGARLHRIRDQHGEIGGRSLVMTAKLSFPNDTETNLQRVDWVDVDHTGDILFARNGSLYRLKPKPNAAPKHLIDLTPLTVTNVPPPEHLAGRRPYRGKAGDPNAAQNVESWHPLDDE
jgi:hypothetical protein